MQKEKDLLLADSTTLDVYEQGTAVQKEMIRTLPAQIAELESKATDKRSSADRPWWFRPPVKPARLGKSVPRRLFARGKSRRGKLFLLPARRKGAPGRLLAQHRATAAEMRTVRTGAPRGRGRVLRPPRNRPLCPLRAGVPGRSVLHPGPGARSRSNPIERPR